MSKKNKDLEVMEKSVTIQRDGKNYSASEFWLGKKCMGAYTAMPQKRFMWQGKCDISDATLERVKNYKKPQ